MKRMQILLPDALYAKLKKKAKEQEQTVTELIRRSVELQVESTAEETSEPSLPTFNLGVPKVPESEWRDLANDRGL